MEDFKGCLDGIRKFQILEEGWTYQGLVSSRCKVCKITGGFGREVVVLQVVDLKSRIVEQSSGAADFFEQRKRFY